MEHDFLHSCKWQLKFAMLHFLFQVVIWTSINYKAATTLSLRSAQPESCHFYISTEAMTERVWSEFDYKMMLHGREFCWNWRHSIDFQYASVNAKKCLCKVIRKFQVPTVFLTVQLIYIVYFVVDTFSDFSLM